ncbi:membrane protein insertion efficiency factor YidD [Nostoc sp. NIES-2111]
MQISSLDSFTRKIGIVAIAGYQKHISPHKGFVCAHRILYGGESCSAYIKRVITEEGLSAAWGKSHTRFQACKQADLTLQAHKMKRRVLHMENSEPTEQADAETEGDEQSKYSRQKSSNSYSSESSCGDSCSDCSDIPDCSGLTDCASLDCSGADCGSLDCSHADCSSLDCSSADCGSLDCGGCGN